MRNKAKHQHIALCIEIEIAMQSKLNCIAPDEIALQRTLNSFAPTNEVLQYNRNAVLGPLKCTGAPPSDGLLLICK